MLHWSKHSYSQIIRQESERKDQSCEKLLPGTERQGGCSSLEGTNNVAQALVQQERSIQDSEKKSSLLIMGNCSEKSHYIISVS